MNEEITADVHFTRGYQKGFSDAQETLSLKMSKSIEKHHETAYDQGVQDCYRILLDQLNEIIKDCRFQDEYAFKYIRSKLFESKDYD